MKIAVFSDSHDNMTNLARALEIVHERNITNGIHLGDFCAPFVMEEIAKAGIQWKCVWGNVDGDKLQAYQKAAPYGTVDIVPGDFREITVEGRTLFLTHYPDIARLAALSGKYDAVFHGHNHLAAQEVVKTAERQTLVANPGEIYGMRYGKPSFGIYDTETNMFEHVEI